MKGSEAAKEILKYAGSNDAITVWGWMPRLYVMTNRRQGTQTGHTFWEMRRDKGYLERFMRKLNQNHPAVFVDAVGPSDFGSSRREKSGHEQFPEVASFVEKNYSFVAEVEAIRIYALRSRVTP